MNEPLALSVLLGTSLSVAVVHTLIGVDHTLPFVALGRARGWSLRRVLAITAACGLGHVGSSVVLGLAGVALGTAVQRLQWVQSVRGSAAAWLLIAFGGFFAARGLLRPWLRRRSHSHVHAHSDGLVHEHPHDHSHAAHVHPHPTASARSATVWTLFVIFVLGPCEPLIPLMMAPAAGQNWLWVGIVSLAFGAATLAAMLGAVTVAYLGVSRLSLPFLERHAELLAGTTIAASGIAIQALGI